MKYEDLFEYIDQIKILREEKGESYKAISENFQCSDTLIRKFCIENQINKKDSIIIGKIFEKSKLQVLERDFNPPFTSHETAYKCKCIECNQVKTYRKSNIINGPGCHECSGTLGGRGYREWKIGQKFGYIEVLDIGTRNGYILGKCECGTIREFSLRHLKGQKGQGHSRTISCGCKQQSSGELKISEILSNNNINYIAQYKIEDFSKFASFDFAIFDNNNNLIKLIEFDGIQHFEIIEAFGGEEKFKIQQERDKRKNKYCKDNNINLLRIPYWDYEKIDLEYLLS